jgi:hypothetical protein
MMERDRRLTGSKRGQSVSQSLWLFSPLHSCVAVALCAPHGVTDTCSSSAQRLLDPLSRPDTVRAEVLRCDGVGLYVSAFRRKIVRSLWLFSPLHSCVAVALCAPHDLPPKRANVQTDPIALSPSSSRPIDQCRIAQAEVSAIQSWSLNVACPARPQALSRPPTRLPGSPHRLQDTPRLLLGTKLFVQSWEYASERRVVRMESNRRRTSQLQRYDARTISFQEGAGRDAVVNPSSPKPLRPLMESFNPPSSRSEPFGPCSQALIPFGLLSVCFVGAGTLLNTARMAQNDWKVSARVPRYVVAFPQLTSQGTGIVIGLSRL